LQSLHQRVFVVEDRDEKGRAGHTERQAEEHADEHVPNQCLALDVQQRCASHAQGDKDSECEQVTHAKTVGIDAVGVKAIGHRFVVLGVIEAQIVRVAYNDASDAFVKPETALATSCAG
jgi:hypothetical protein